MIARDITELERSRERKDFLNTLIRQDLGSKYQTVQGYLNLLKEADLSEENRKYLKKSIKAGQEADEILNLARDLEEIEETELISEKDIKEVLKHAIGEIHDLIERKGTKIETDYAEETSKIEGDHSLKIFFKNLLATIIEVSKAKKIKINTKEREKDVLVRIDCDGKRLPKAIKNISTGETYTEETVGAGGVRYYMLNEIANYKNAQINAKDSKLGGTRFNIILKKT